MKSPHPSNQDASEAGAGRGPGFRVIWLGGEGRSLNMYLEILRSLPHGTGMAFVVGPNRIQRHLRPEVLSVVSKMPVVEVEDGMSLVADCVFIASPGRRLSMDKGVFRLRKHVPPPEWPKAVNALLHSLVNDLGNRMVAVVLSGLNEDIITAFKAVKDGGGITVAQSDGSSGLAFETGHIDHLPSAEDLAQVLIAFGTGRTGG